MRAGFVICIFVLMQISCSQKKIHLKQKDFKNPISFAYHNVTIVTDKENFNSFFSEDLKSTSEPSFQKLLDQTQTLSLVPLYDSTVSYLHLFLDRELDKGKVQIIYGARKQKARFIKRKTYGVSNIKKKGQHYYIENEKNYFYTKILDHTIIDF